MVLKWWNESCHHPNKSYYQSRSTNNLEVETRLAMFTKHDLYDLLNMIFIHAIFVVLAQERINKWIAWLNDGQENLSFELFDDDEEATGIRLLSKC